MLRYASKRRQQTAILMHAYMEANTPPLQKIKDAFKECLEKNKRLCHVHYAETAQYIACLLAEIGVQFSHYRDPRASGGTAYLNEGDIPYSLVKYLNDAVKVIDEKVVITARDIGQFMNRCLQQYFSEYRFGKKLDPSTLAELKPEELPYSWEEHVVSEVEQLIDIHDREVDVTTLLSAPDPGFLDPPGNDDNGSSSYKDEASTSDAGIVSEEDGIITSVKLEPNTDEPHEDFAELKETDPVLMKQVFTVDGQALLELFRFCPSCGCALREKGGVQLTADGSTPIVHYICGLCSQPTSSLRIWEGRKNNDEKLELEEES
ncbi:hypothetical protein Y032_0280g1212 [Ancylostoma ceylanicum]|nr:hypothetical protein Y032_0280g1212 [Ancylostoma ceylanicum]